MLPAGAHDRAAAMPARGAASPSGQDANDAAIPWRGTDADVVHRVVWDQWRRGRKGIHLRSALLDGTDRRPVYDSRRGWTLELSLDRSGQRVAFAPCCRSELPTMVVAPVLGGEAFEPLKNHPRIYAVGGIGWSPDGRRIAFEGWHGKAPDHHKSIWTIRPDGSGLRNVLDRPRGRFDASPSLAWTTRTRLSSSPSSTTAGIQPPGTSRRFASCWRALGRASSLCVRTADRRPWCRLLPVAHRRVSGAALGTARP